MNYRKIYESIIEKAKSENREKGKKIYYESHHIQPRCLNGNDEDDNLVLLTAKEHFVCHKLLTKIYPSNSGINLALFAMVNYKDANRKEKIKISGRDYQNIKEEISKCGFSKEHSQNISKSHIGKRLSNKHKFKIKQGLSKYKKPNKFSNLTEEELKSKKVGKYNNFHGYTHKNEKNYKEKYTTRKGITPANALKVKNMKTGEIFNSTTGAAKEFDNPSTARRGISDVCKGKREFYKNVKFEFVK
jgi:hypothetical protein